MKHSIIAHGIHGIHLLATTVALALALVLPASIASAEGLPKLLIRTSVIDIEGTHVSGFITQRGTIERYVSETIAAGRTFPEGVHIVPASVDTFDVAQVQAYLAGQGIETTPRLRQFSRCSIPRADRDPDGNGGRACFADDGLAGSVGASGSRTVRRW